MEKFCFIVIDFNSYLRTIQFLKDLFTLYNEKVKVVIVDNSNNISNFNNMLHKANEEFGPYVRISQNAFSIKFESNEVLLLNPKENLGYAKGNNYGAKAASEYWEFKHFIFSNNDIVFEYLDIEEITKIFSEDSNIGIVGIKQIDLNGENQNPRRNINIWKKIIFPNLFSLFFNSKVMRLVVNDRVDVNTKENNLIEVDWISGAFMIVRKQSFDDVNGFDNNTFLYGEELILSHKIREINKKVIYNPKSKIIHEHGGTTRKQSNLFIEKENFYSHYYYYKHYMKVSYIELLIAKYAFEFHKKCNYPIKQKIKKYFLN